MLETGDRLSSWGDRGEGNKPQDFHSRWKSGPFQQSRKFQNFGLVIFFQENPIFKDGFQYR